MTLYGNRGPLFKESERNVSSLYPIRLLLRDTLREASGKNLEEIRRKISKKKEGEEGGKG